jgi:hypothetical protein
LVLIGVARVGTDRVASATPGIGRSCIILTKVFLYPCFTLQRAPTRPIDVTESHPAAENYSLTATAAIALTASASAAALTASAAALTASAAALTTHAEREREEEKTSG